METKDWVILLLSFISGVFSSILAALFIGPVKEALMGYNLTFIFSKYLGRIPWFCDRVFADQWIQSWQVKSENFPSQNSSPICFHRFGKFLAGNFTYSHLGDSIEYRIFAKIMDSRNITGLWYDCRKNGYYGSFQVILNPQLHSAKGKWIGFAESGTVKTGNWHWEKVLLT